VRGQNTYKQAAHKQPVVNIYSTEGADLNQIRLQQQGFVGGFMGAARAARILSLACHSQEVAFAVATDDNYLSVFVARLRSSQIWRAAHQTGGETFEDGV